MSPEQPSNGRLTIDSVSFELRYLQIRQFRANQLQSKVLLIPVVDTVVDTAIDTCYPPNCACTWGFLAL